MKRFKFTLLATLFSFFLVLTPGLAQTADGQQNQSEQPQAAPEQNVPAFDETRYFDSWRADCFDKVYNGLRCQLKQHVTDLGTNTLIAQLVIYNNSEDKSDYFLMRLPLGLDLKKQVSIVIGDYKKTFSYAYCDPSGCYVEDKVDSAFINNFKQGNGGTADIATREGATASIQFSLIGFTKALNFIQSKN